jgi:hypothetical protein
MQAVRAAGREEPVRAEVRAIVDADLTGFLEKVVGAEIGLR